MTTEQVRNLLISHRHRIFRVIFRKRSTGELRVMRCRLHVVKGVEGVQPDRREQDRVCDCLTVFEMAGKNSGFKRIPLDAVLSINGKEISQN